MRMLRAPITPNAAAESEQLIRARLAVRVRIWEGLPENERQVHISRDLNLALRSENRAKPRTLCKSSNYKDGVGPPRVHYA